MRSAFSAPRSFAAMFCSAAAIGLLAAPAGATTFTTLYKFCSKANCVDGGNPLQSPLRSGRRRQFFGTAQNGGAKTGGVMYELYQTAVRLWR